MTPTDRSVAGAALALGLAAAAAAPVVAETIVVTDLAGAVGAAALQAALDRAAASPEDSVIVLGEAGARVELAAGLQYRGASGLTIFGNGLRLASTANLTLLRIEEARAVHLSGLVLEGAGGWSVVARGELADGAATGAPPGLRIDLGAAATGMVRVVLEDLRVTGTAGPGIAILDCAGPCGDPGETGTGDAQTGEAGAGDGPTGSEAGIALTLRDVEIANVGLGAIDGAGIRIDEGGPGDVSLHAIGLRVTGSGGDGIALTEAQEGGVTIRIAGLVLEANGAYCDPGLLSAHLPDITAAGYEAGAATLADIPGPVAESPDDACFLREIAFHPDGSPARHAFDLRRGHGLRVAEAGAGGLSAALVDVEVFGNSGAGLALAEAGPGDLDAQLADLFAEANGGDAVAVSEDGDGALALDAARFEALANGGAGLAATETGAGDLMLVLRAAATVGNGHDDHGTGGPPPGLGILAEQRDEGTGTVHVIDSEIADGIETRGAAIDPD